MGLPQIDIKFYTLAASAVKRSSRGVVALILKDNTKTTFDTKEYKSIDEIDSADWTEANLDYIKKTFEGIPSKVIVERINTTETDDNKALTRLKNKVWNYIAVPGADSVRMQTLATWIKTQRDNNKKTFKAIVSNVAADHEGIINFTTDEIEVGTKKYTSSEYTCRIAGILAGISFDKSSTYYALNEVTNIKEHNDPNGDIDSGKLILIKDGSKIKIGRGVNSLVSMTISKGAKFKKIKIMEAIDQMRDDIYKVFNDEYVGKVNNSYDNKILFLSSINAYFKQLQRDEILDPNFEAKSEIDIDAQKIYLQSIGVNLDNLKEQEIKEYNTGSKIFLKAKGSPLDAMEDLSFGMLIA